MDEILTLPQEWDYRLEELEPGTPSRNAFLRHKLRDGCGGPLAVYVDNGT